MRVRRRAVSLAAAGGVVACAVVCAGEDAVFVDDFVRVDGDAKRQQLQRRRRRSAGGTSAIGAGAREAGQIGTLGNVGTCAAPSNC